MASELAEAISEAVDSTSNHAELIDRVIAENGEVSCIYCGKVSFKGLTLENGRWSSVASKAMADHMLSCPDRPEAKLTERIRTLESACEAAITTLRLVEWVNRGDHISCPGCGNWKEYGHHPQCPIRRTVEQLEAIKHG